MDRKLYAVWAKDAPWKGGLDTSRLVRTLPSLEEELVPDGHEMEERKRLALDLRRMSGFQVRTAIKSEQTLEALRALGYTQ